MAEPASTVARDLVEYVRLLASLLPPVALTATLVVGAVTLVSSAFWARETPHWATPATMLAVVWLSYGGFMASMSLHARPKDYRRAMGGVATMLAHVAFAAAGLALVLPPPGAAHRLPVLCALVLPGLQLAVSVFAYLHAAGRTWPFSRLAIICWVSITVPAGFAVCLTNAWVVQRQESGAATDVFFSGVVYPMATAGLVRLVYADLCSFMIIESSPYAARRHSVRATASAGCDGGERCKSLECGANVTLESRAGVMCVIGSFGRQAFCSCGVWVQLQMTSPAVFAASLALATLLELVGTHVYFRLLAESAEATTATGKIVRRATGVFMRSTTVVPAARSGWSAPTEQQQRQRERRQLRASKCVPGFFLFWIKARAKEDWRARLTVLYRAEEVGERVSVTALGIAVVALQVLLPKVRDTPPEPNLGFAAAKFAAVVIAEMVEDLTKKRMLRKVCAGGGATASPAVDAVEEIVDAASTMSWLRTATLSSGALMGVCTYYIVL